MNKVIEWSIIVLAAVLIVYFISPYTSSQPDGLKKTAEKLNAGEEAPVSFVALGDYSVPISAVAGVLVVFILVFAVLWPSLVRK